MCVQPGRMCVGEMHHIDATGGAGRKARRIASGSTTMTPPGDRARARRRHLPRDGPPAAGLRAAGGRDAPRQNMQPRRRQAMTRRRRTATPGAEAGPPDRWPTERHQPRSGEHQHVLEPQFSATHFRAPVARSHSLPRAHPPRDLRRRRARRRGAAGRRHLVRQVGLSLARMVHERRSQEDRHHVRRARHRDAAARLRRRGHDDHPEGALGRRVGGLPAPAPLRPGLHGPRHDHDLLHGHALRDRRHELRHAAADRRARCGLPLPEQFQLLDDDGRRGPHHAVLVRRRIRRATWLASRRCRGRRTARASASTTISGDYRSRASARRCRAST